MMKVYLHLEDASAVTVVISTDDTQYTILSAAKEFCRQAVSHGKQLSSENISIKRKNGKLLPKTSMLADVAKNREDLWIHVEKAEVWQKDTKAPVSKIKESKTSVISRLIEKAKELQKAKQERKAVDKLEEVLKIQPSCFEALMLLGDIYLQVGRGKKALKFYKEAKQKQPENPQCKYKLGQCYLHLSRADEALELLLEYGKQLRHEGGVTTQQKYDLQVALCKAYQQKDQRDMAIVVAQGIVRQTREHIPGLVEFAKLTFDLGELQAYEAIAVLLTARVMHRDDKYIAQVFAETCKKPMALDHLEKTAGESWNSPEALIFLANTMRDYGAIEQSIVLLEHALDVMANHVPAMLVYVHTLEIAQQFDKAFHVISDFLSRFPTMTVDGVTNQSVLSVIQDGCQPTEASKSKKTDLHLLALWFTLVKIIYFDMPDKHVLLPKLVALLLPIHKGNKLHTTAIRNEAAYFICISKVLELGEITPVSDDVPCVYFVGDSHCCSPAWRTCKIKETVHQIVPILSTGTKIWHLREESVFYPKVTFHNAIARIPEQASVIICLGEIDCREGLLQAVERCKYENLEDAMDRIVRIYVSILKNLQKSNQWQLYIHPVVPVLDVTRFLVMMFNQKLAECIEQETSLHWLNFVDELLEDDKLKEGYQLDGTHLHPRYVTLIEETVARIAN